MDKTIAVKVACSIGVGFRRPTTRISGGPSISMRPSSRVLSKSPWLSRSSAWSRDNIKKGHVLQLSRQTRKDHSTRPVSARYDTTRIEFIGSNPPRIVSSPGLHEGSSSDHASRYISSGSWRMVLGSQHRKPMVLSTRDPVQVQQALERFRASRLRLEEAQVLGPAVESNACTCGYSYQSRSHARAE
jgi:hypothetical protein